MDKRYKHTQNEEIIYKKWEDAECFNPDVVKVLREKNAKCPAGKKKALEEQSNSDKSTTKSKPFTIMMPPPNANDPLHVGHAIFVALEDIMIRYHRMKGDDTLWLPGTDHAGIETQFVFEKKLRKKGKSRFNYDRKTLYKMIWDYVQENSDLAVTQIKKLGASADWSRFKFMLDDNIVEEVLGTFDKLHKENLIYRDLKLVNYCTKCGTSYSELEVNHEDKTDPLYTFQYGDLTVATVRPETIFGDVALAVNPEDSRYSKYVGKDMTATFPWGEVSLPVIADDYVKMDFGTGVLKITPYHDPNDWAVWQRHKKDLAKPIQIVNNMGKLQNVPEEYLGMGVNPARVKVVEDLKNFTTENNPDGLILEEKKSLHSVGTCYRCSRTIEPLPLAQFFIKVKPLTEPILEALEKKEVTIHGAGHDKILKHWLENLYDWNISRQIVWGISIPVWYPITGNEEEITVGFLNKEGKFTQGQLNEILGEYSLEEVKEGLQQVYVSENVEYIVSQDDPGDKDTSEENNNSGDKNTSNSQEISYLPETDTFDTWFSSAQWPYTTLKTTQDGDFERFYPTQVMETGYDILPFWVMRMLMMGKFVTGELPFTDVYLHGMARDQHGKKMSKSKGNVVNPLVVTEKFGADALRMALVIRSTAGLDKSVSDSDFKAMRNFSNKIWNAARFIIMQLDETQQAEDGFINEKAVKENAPGDKEFSKKLSEVVTEITRNLDTMKPGLAAENTYNEFWHWYCDECIEKSKNGDISQKSILLGLTTFLKLLHPFVPFVTEAVWQELVKSELVEDELLIVSEWPKS